MRRFVRAALTLASVAMVAPAVAEAQAKPVVAVLYFDNNSIGKDARDFDGIGKGLADMLITDMSQNANIRVVERERVQALLTEQNLVKAGTIDPQTAIRLGKFMGAQYMVYGGFMSNGQGTYVLTARATNVETSVISNPIRITSKGDDVLALMNDLSMKITNEMKLPALRVGDAGASSATPAGQPAAAPATDVKVADAKPATAKPAEVRVAKSESKARKMDIKTAMLYSKALEEADAGNRAKSLELFRQVDVKFPDYAPVKKQIDRLSRG